MSGSSINSKEKALKNSLTYRAGERILNKGTMKEMHEGFLVSFKTQIFLGSDKMLFPDFSSKFISPCKGGSCVAREVLEILCCPMFGYDIPILNHFSSFPLKVTPFLDGNVDSPCFQPSPVSFFLPEIPPCFYLVINFSFLSWFKKVRQESSHLTFIAFTLGVLLLRLWCMPSRSPTRGWPALLSPLCSTLVPKSNALINPQVIFFSPYSR